VPGGLEVVPHEDLGSASLIVLLEKPLRPKRKELEGGSGMESGVGTVLAREPKGWTETSSQSFSS
jgi:hypothetical protein